VEEVKPSVTNDRRHPDRRIHRSDVALVTCLSLPQTADQSRGSNNLATTPRAGNISTDMRAGYLA
jgi:hypothetical protein